MVATVLTNSPNVFRPYYSSVRGNLFVKIAIMQPYLFPYIGYFQLINAVDRFIIYDDVNYIKKGWINRNRVLANCKASMFTLPLRKASQNKLIYQIEISPEYDKWKTKFLKTIERSYSKSPYYLETLNVIEEILACEDRQLSPFIIHSLKTVCDRIGISTPIVRSKDRYGNTELKGQDRIIDIVCKEGASTYINPINGIELYNQQHFAERETELLFLKSRVIRYPQLSKEFVPFLSILDVMMSVGLDSTRELLTGYDTIKPQIESPLPQHLSHIEKREQKTSTAA